MSNAKESIQRFFSWWGDGLYEGLPESLRQLVRVNHPSLILTAKSNDLLQAVWQENGKCRNLGEIDLSNPGLLDADFLPSKLAKKKYVVELRLNQQQVLFLQKNFPENVQLNLVQAIRYQLDRLTPFEADDAFFDAVVSDHDKAQKEIVADIHIVPKHIVERFLRGISPIGIDKFQKISVDGVSDKINMAAVGDIDDRAESKPSKWPLYLFLGALIVSLLGPLAYKHRRVTQINDAISDLKSRASEQLAIRDKLYEAEEALTFLRQKRATNPMALDVVENLSRELPKHTYLEKLELKGDVLEFRGESGNALSLIDVLEHSKDFSGAQFQSQVVRNKKNGRDKFHIKTIAEVPRG